MTNGIAHLSFRGGGLFLPTRTPYDRQLFREHMLERVRATGNVQVLLGSQRWLVYVEDEHHAAAAPTCAGCQRELDARCYCGADPRPYCTRCAAGDAHVAATLPRLRAVAQ